MIGVNVVQLLVACNFISLYDIYSFGFILIGFFPQACKLKLGDLKGALLDADFALREREGNAKAYFRQGQVSMFSLKIYLC